MYPLIDLTSDGPVLPVFDTYEEWAAFAKPLGALVKQSLWLLGDWLIAGEQRFGEMYAQALDLTGLDYDTLRTAKWLAGRFPPERRRDNLTWSHHREVAALPVEQQERLLDLAAPTDANPQMPRLSTRELRDEARMMAAGRRDSPEQELLRSIAAQLHAATNLLVEQGEAKAADTLRQIERLAVEARETLSAWTVPA